MHERDAPVSYKKFDVKLLISTGTLGLSISPSRFDMKLAPTDETSEMESAQNFMKNDSIFAGELNRGVISSREKKPTTS